MEKNNAVIVSLFVFGLLGIFFIGAGFGTDFLTGKVTETDKGILEVTTFPDGAIVSAHFTPRGVNTLFGGKFKSGSQDILNFCVTPCLQSAVPGKYKLTIKKDGYADNVKEVDVIQGRTEIFRVQLEPLGRVTATSNPSRAKVSFYLNGKLMLSDMTPLGKNVVGRALPSGNYDVVFELKGYQSQTKKVEVKNSGITYVRANLVPA